MSGIYIHIPFCKQACSYCDFYFVTRHQNKQAFVDELIKEIHAKKDSVFADEPVQTIYFGGGTPSLLSADQVYSILNAISETFALDLKEITIEMNPDDVNPNYLQDLKSAGINRASMGVQTFDPELLQFMNRAHTADEALNCLQILKESAFQVFTVDLIYGNPGQSLAALEKDIDTLLAFEPPHISAYSLTVEPQTRLGKQVQLGRILAPEDDTVADHFDLVERKFSETGIRQYEVSNFAKPGCKAIHNSNYWSHKNYLGFGPAAHSFWWDVSRKSAKRWSNESDLNSYLNSGWKQPFEIETLDLPSLAEERLMLALRTREGISEEELNNRYEFEFSESQQKYLNKMEAEQKLTKNGALHLTKKGLKIADVILLDLLTH